MSTGSPDACLTASFAGTSKGLLRVGSQSSSPDQPAACKAPDEALHTVSHSVANTLHVHTASNDTSPTLLQRNLDSRDPNCCQPPDSEQQADSKQAELEAKDSSDTDLADLGAPGGQHSRSGTGLVSEPAHRLQDAAVVSEPVSRLADDLTVSEPASMSADAVVVPEPANSLPGTESPRSGSESSNHSPHVTSRPDVAEPSVSGSSPQQSPTTGLSQQVISAEDDSPESSEAGAGTDAVPEPSTVGSDSPHPEQLTATSRTDTDPGASTAGSDSPHTERQATATGTDAVPEPSSASYDSPQAGRRSSCAAASTSDADEAAPGLSMSAQKAEAQTGISVTCNRFAMLSLAGACLLWLLGNMRRPSL